MEEIERGVKEAHGVAPVRIEGLQDATWVLMDYGDFIAHVFLQETRELLRPRAPLVRAPRVPWRRDVEDAGLTVGRLRSRRSGTR